MNPCEHISALIQSGHISEAVSELAVALRLDPSNWGLHYLKGRVHEELNELDQAITSLKTAVELNPEQEAIFWTLGQAFERSGNLPSAIAAIERSTQLNPGFTPAWFSLGEIFCEVGRYSDALAAYESCVEALALNIVGNLENSCESKIHKHENIEGDFWLRSAMNAAIAAAKSDGLLSIAIPDGNSAVQEELTEEHAGLYFVDSESEGKAFRFLLPNYFNTFRERFRQDNFYAVLLTHIGFAYLELGNNATARERFIEATHFIPAGKEYRFPFEGLQLCELRNRD